MTHSINSTINNHMSSEVASRNSGIETSDCVLAIPTTMKARSYALQLNDMDCARIAHE